MDGWAHGVLINMSLKRKAESALANECIAKKPRIAISQLPLLVDCMRLEDLAHIVLAYASLVKTDREEEDADDVVVPEIWRKSFRASTYGRATWLLKDETTLVTYNPWVDNAQGAEIKLWELKTGHLCCSFRGPSDDRTWWSPQISNNKMFFMRGNLATDQHWAMLVMDLQDGSTSLITELLSHKQWPYISEYGVANDTILVAARTDDDHHTRCHDLVAVKNKKPTHHDLSHLGFIKHITSQGLVECRDRSYRTNILDFSDKSTCRLDEHWRDENPPWRHGSQLLLGTHRYGTIALKIIDWQTGLTESSIMLPYGFELAAANSDGTIYLVNSLSQEIMLCE